ncbi:MAG: MarR family transcriptional regulator [Bacteroidota bacterium]
MKSVQLRDVSENLFSLKHMFFKVFGKPVQFNSKITPLAYFILQQLRDQPTLSMTEISNKLGIPKPNVTVLVDKLIVQKLAERISDKTDRRIVMIKLTKKGSGFLDTSRKKYHTQVADKLSLLPEKEQKNFADALTTIKNTLTVLENIG